MLNFVSERNFWVDIPVEMCAWVSGLQHDQTKPDEVEGRSQEGLRVGGPSPEDVCGFTPTF